MDLGLTWFQEWLLDFVQDILFHDPVIQLALAFTVESESSHLAFNVSTDIKIETLLCRDYELNTGNISEHALLIVSFLMFDMRKKIKSNPSGVLLRERHTGFSFVE